ncbi:unnamed protein product [Mycena citricolor]|uniref:P-loop containing nucleoside triphosphate hydrolase protein n=1 Tax=Mycena citricolor TaxID=2018698 RepID=A0AAD2K619_9AGAR|nr:unnamed protein product [Mycena citricolor]
MDETHLSAALDAIDQNWFVNTTRRARWMDLLGDYAGTELFLISGESLLKTVLDDALLALGHAGDLSFQILHAYYLLENALLEFTSRNANFEIVFWQSERHSTIHTGASALVVTSRALARALLFQHLQKLDVVFRLFSDTRDPSWLQYEEERRPMFVMLHDGGVGDGKDVDRRTLLQRMTMLDLVDRGLSIAFLNGVEFRDSKVLTFVYHGDHRSSDHQGFADALCIAKGARKELDEALRDQFESSLALNALNPPMSVPLHAQTVFLARIRNKLEDSDLVRELLFVFLTHVVLLPSLPLSDRAQPIHHLHSHVQTYLLDTFLPAVFSVLAVAPLEVDGRVFAALLAYIVSNPTKCISEIVPGIEEFAAQWSLSMPVFRVLQRYATSICDEKLDVPHPVYEVLPFHHPALDTLPLVDDPSSMDTRDAPSSVYSDAKHWHNDQSILPRYLGGQDRPVLSAWEKQRRNRGNQLFMVTLQRTAETLTGALGTGLRKISIAPVKDLPQVRHAQPMFVTQKAKQQKKSKKELLREEIQQKKLETRNDSSGLWWKERLVELKELSLNEQAAKFALLLRNPRSAEPMLGLEMHLFMLDLTIRRWKESPSSHDDFALNMLKCIKNMLDLGLLNPTATGILEEVFEGLGFKDYAPAMLSTSLDDRLLADKPISFDFVRLFSRRHDCQPKLPSMAIRENPIIWQLRVFGDYMDRSMDSSVDARVSFWPDAWQKRVLDCIDEGHSILVIAPTSAGKTFISYYAMEKVLRGSNDGILVYVAPTKALVSQVAAEVYARYEKSVDGMNLWAIHTRDYRINDPLRCQILVTVPEILATLLLSPPLARVWIPRMKSIILDEIHSIGQQEGGTVWEQIILMAPCPIIGLSATVGSPEGFSQWLASVQKQHGFRYSEIIHPHRYSHLRKFFYDLQGQTVAFNGLDVHTDTGRARFLHPISLIPYGTWKITEDLALEARDTLSLYRELERSEIPGHEELHPVVFFKGASRLLVQRDIIRYEQALKRKLEECVLPDRDRTLAITCGLMDEHVRLQLQSAPSKEAYQRNVMILLSDLHVRGELPVILFSFDRTECERIARSILETLERAESLWRATSPVWAQDVKRFESWKAGEAARRRKADAAAARKSKVKSRRPDQGNSGGDERDQGPSYNPGSTFDPNEPSRQFTFADVTRYSRQDLAEDIERLTWRASVPGWALAALKRGVGVHHAGMNKKYRSVIESLFRRGYIRVMIATGTLALGINAPAKTTVFCGDSPYLTALMVNSPLDNAVSNSISLQYRQCAGRAGRRGFDLRGNVVFYGLPLDRVQRMVLSKIPPLGGNFPLTSTLCLRLLSMLSGSNNADSAVAAVDSILKLPRISFVSDIGRDQVLHHMRFSIEYLRRMGLVDCRGQPSQLFSLTAHLYYHEPSNFALVALLNSGVLEGVCAQHSLESAKHDLVLVLAHLFGRRYLSRSSLPAIEKLVKKYPSQVVLPPLPHAVRTVLVQHDLLIRDIFRGYAAACASQLGPRDSVLPFSNTAFAGHGGECTPFQAYLRKTAITVSARSLFVATSGHTDSSFSDTAELTRSARHGLHLNNNAVPSMGHLAADGEHALNAYLLDFYVHGQKRALVDGNGIREGDLWQLLQDFSLTLATIRASLSGTDDEVFGVDAAEVEDGEGEGVGSVGENSNSVLAVMSAVKEEFDEKFKNIWA